MGYAEDVSDLHPLERIAELEQERDALRARLASFERGERDAAHRAEVARLEEQLDKLRDGNADMKRRIEQLRRRRRRPDGSNALSELAEALAELWRTIVGK
jgi:septal ring factor EnvC (AmiA/AmiB activator)